MEKPFLSCRYLGGLRLLQATCKKFYQFCSSQGWDKRREMRRTRYTTERMRECLRWCLDQDQRNYFNVFFNLFLFTELLSPNKISLSSTTPIFHDKWWVKTSRLLIRFTQVFWYKLNLVSAPFVGRIWQNRTLLVHRFSVVQCFRL